MTYLIHPAQKYYADNDTLFPNICCINLYDNLKWYITLKIVSFIDLSIICGF